jgi:hypothetical protein
MDDRETQIYKDAMEEKLEACKRRGITVKFVGDDVLQDYIGMNSEAAKAMGFKWPEGLGKEPSKWVLVGETLHSKIKYETLVHEMVEMGLMGDGRPYWPSHLVALKKEHIKPRKRLKISRRRFHPPAAVSLAAAR